MLSKEYLSSMVFRVVLKPVLYYLFKLSVQAGPLFLSRDFIGPKIITCRYNLLHL